MRRFRNRYLLVIDAALLSATAWALYAMRVESPTLGPVHARTAAAFILAAVPLQLAVLLAFGLYRRLWRHASVAELERIFIAGIVAALPTYLIGRYGIVWWGLAGDRAPLSVLLPYSMLSIGIVAAPRLLIRIGGLRAQLHKAGGDRRILIVGAGVAGEMIVRELSRNLDLGMTPVGFVDDDPMKHKLTLAGVPIIGPLSDIPKIVRLLGVSEVVIAMPRAPGAVIRSVLRAAQDAGAATRIMPGLFDILADRVSVSSIREVRIEDLLRRDPIQTDLAAVSSLATGKTVLVTGAGGSIGSELCRQLYSLQPARLILVGHGENPVFEILNELRRTPSETEVVPVIADVRMEQRVREIFARYRPHAVFHAAAHKHVPLMEDNPVEAVTNNVLGTRNVVEAAVQYAAQHFVLISTDKAVRPTNVMGATKRLAEYVVQNAARRHGVNFVAVRFGNVLGSQGSVVPIFMRQIRDGGPVTVTHPEMRRYFMTIPEAVQLVLQAGAQGKGGELFMLDMGEPVKIVDLARDLIRLSGFDEDDLGIEFTGIRPGEKLYEEMFFSHEIAEPTEHPKILRARNGHDLQCDPAAIAQLVEFARGANVAGAEVRRRLRLLVPDYRPENSGNPQPVAGAEIEPRQTTATEPAPLLRVRAEPTAETA